jgi:hypothetical protein
LSARRRRREAGARSGKQAKDGSSKLTEAPKESMHEKSKKQ